MRMPPPGHRRHPRLHHHPLLVPARKIRQLGAHIPLPPPCHIQARDKRALRARPGVRTAGGPLLAFHMVQFFLFVGRYILYVNTLTGRFVAWLSSWDVTLVDDSPAIFNVECRRTQYLQHTTEWAAAVPFASPAVLRALRAWTDAEAADPNGLRPHFPFEIRFSAPDGVWLSPSYGRRCVGLGSRNISASSFQLSAVFLMGQYDSIHSRTDAANYLYLVTTTLIGPQLLTQSQTLVVAVYVVSTSISSGVVQFWLARMAINLYDKTMDLDPGHYGLHLRRPDWGRCYRGPPRHVTPCLSGCVGADAVITAVLLIKFHTILVSFIRRFSFAAVRNGSITTIMTCTIRAVSSRSSSSPFSPRRIITIGRLHPSPSPSFVLARTNPSKSPSPMLFNLNNRFALLGEPQSGTSYRKTLVDAASPKIMRIREDIETHYRSRAAWTTSARVQDVLAKSKPGG
ncbi:hypothetical protein C8R44DRAFT_749689 [Mycena epipterygia]|nr:hypothetical protein C8R44DRAFT_749689 [Mycena epipterygia]